MKQLSIIIPVANEAGNIAKLHQETVTACLAAGYEFEVIIIDDGSSDGTAEIVKNLSPVKLVRFRRNFGQTAGLDAGIKQAKFGLLATMDGDGQNDPADIPRLVRYLEENDLDAVSGWRKNRRDKFGKRLASRGADWLRKFLINDGVHDSGCGLKIYRRECFEQINLYGELHRFIPALLKIKGFKIGELTVNHRPRTAGRTKYNWQRMIKGLIDLISVWFWGKFALRPLHLLGGLGMLLTVVGVIFSIYTTYMFILGVNPRLTVWSLLSAFFLLMGVQLFVSGLLADMLTRNYYESAQAKPYYNIKEIIEKK